MLLSRVIDHVKAQNWTAVVLDFVIVVAGILIAFQITEWNEARRDRTLEREYLQRFYVDTIGSIERQNEFAQWDDLRIETQGLVLDILRKGELAEKDVPRFNDGLLYFGYLQPMDFRWAAIEELKSTGRIGLIRNKKLRDLIIKTEAEYEGRMEMRQYIGNRISAYREHIDRRFAVLHAANDDSIVRLDYDFIALTKDAEFLKLLSHIAHNANVLKRVTFRHYQSTLALKAALEELPEIAKLNTQKR